MTKRSLKLNIYLYNNKYINLNKLYIIKNSKLYDFLWCQSCGFTSEIDTHENPLILISIKLMHYTDVF